LYLDLFEQPATRVFQQSVIGFIAARWFDHRASRMAAMSSDSGKEPARRCCERQKLAVARNVIMSRHAHQPTRLYA
jgi:hypothetical protein